jgi:hypothetical protein
LDLTHQYVAQTEKNVAVKKKSIAIAKETLAILKQHAAEEKQQFLRSVARAQLDTPRAEARLTQLKATAAQWLAAADAAKTPEERRDALDAWSKAAHQAALLKAFNKQLDALHKSAQTPKETKKPDSGAAVDPATRAVLTNQSSISAAAADLPFACDNDGGEEESSTSDEATWSSSSAGGHDDASVDSSASSSSSGGGGGGDDSGSGCGGSGSVTDSSFSSFS